MMTVNLIRPGPRSCHAFMLSGHASLVARCPFASLCQKGQNRKMKHESSE